jgi:hypothetical protein
VVNDRPKRRSTPQADAGMGREGISRSSSIVIGLLLTGA